MDFVLILQMKQFEVLTKSYVLPKVTQNKWETENQNASSNSKMYSFHFIKLLPLIFKIRVEVLY